MFNNFLNKKLAGCMIKGAWYADEHKATHGTRPEVFPVLCEYASAGEVSNNPACELARKPIAELDACPRDKKKVRRAIKKTPRLERSNVKNITWVFFKTRNTYHMMRRTNQAYCRDRFNTLRIFHVENMPVSSICAHCYKAFRVERAEIAANIARYTPDSPLFMRQKG